MGYRRIMRFLWRLTVGVLVLAAPPLSVSAQGKADARENAMLSLAERAEVRELDIRPARSSDELGVLWRADNTNLGVIAAFDDRGLRLEGASGRLLDFALAAWAHDGATEPVGPALLRVDGNCLEYLRPDSTEAIVNRADGLGVTIVVAGPATLFDIDLVTGSGVETVIEKRALRLRSADGDGRHDLMLRLAEVRDATGPLDAALSFDRNKQRLRIEVEGETSASVKVALVIDRDSVLRPPAEDNYLEGFGRSVAIAGDLIVVGAPDDDALGSASGAAYLIGLDNASGTWKLIAKLTASDGAPFDHFGASVALWDDIVVIGAPQHDDEARDCGAVYVFEATSGGAAWPQTARLEASQGAEGDNFGAALAIDRETANTIVVGAPSDEHNDLRIGAVFFFEKTAGRTWAEVAAHRAEEDFSGGSFGTAVAIDGDTAVVGAHHRVSDHFDRRGSIHVFRRTAGGWTLTGSFVSPLGHTTDAFGTVLALDDELLVTQSEDLIMVLANSGGENWDMVDLVSAHYSLYPSIQLDIVGDTIVVGQSDASPMGIGSGEIKVWQRGEEPWQSAAVLSPSESVPRLGFGSAVEIDRDVRRLVAGATANPLECPGQNSVWVFDLQADGDWLETRRLDPPPSPSSRFQNFGRALSADGDLLLVGAPNAYEWDKQSGPGRAYLAQRIGGAWSVVARFEKEHIKAREQFGSDVSLSADLAAVLAPYDAAYVYARDTDGEWRLDARLPVAVDNASPYQWGTSVAISGMTLAVGRVGAVAVYERDGDWHETITLRGEEQDSYRFGADVALEHDTLVVASPWGYSGDYPPEPASRASVQVFSRQSGGGWGRTAVLTAPDEVVGTEFGSAVALSGNTIVVGAPETNSTAELAGAAFVFEFDGDAWRRVAELVPSHAIRATRACSAVAVDGDYVLCGSLWATTGASYRGSGTVTIFERNRGGINAWGEMSVLDWDGAVGEQFGASVAIQQRDVWVGVPGEDAVGEDSGVVVTYEIADNAPRRPDGRVQ